MDIRTRQRFESWAAEHDLDLKPERCGYGALQGGGGDTDLAWEAWKSQEQVIEALQKRIASLESEIDTLKRRLDESGLRKA